jgi:hypothetical protein
MLPGDLEVPCGGIERLMTQQHLDRPDIDPRFKQVSRKTMASFLRHPPAATRHRYPHHSAAARATDVATTMIYTHILQQGGQGVPSPLDDLGV